ncbi:MAG: valine--tRNA ligase [Trichlorobacter sp.]|jgi:valyl-tRNA synthetase
MSTELAKGYEPHDVEKKWYRTWTDAGYFHADPVDGRPAYSIVIPPPNVTGALHMGHALNNTLQDILCRWKRMAGHSVLWMPGTDHAGIATQNVVERQLAAAGQDRHDLGREAFIDRVWQWKAESGGQIIGQLKRLGASCDWDRERFTMDAGLSKAVRTVFVRLYEEGLIYRDNRLINWCPRCHTALSDIEVEHEEGKGHLWHLRYPVIGQPGRYLTVATTRPETMLGDTAVAVHPEDERYQDLHGAMVMLPLVERPIPVIADEYVDREFGTGVVKITPAHDFNDFEVGARHGLEKINVFDPSGIINEAGGRYQGLDRFEARKQIVADLEAAELLEKIDDHVLSIGGCYRCKTIVEPYLSLQWYVNVGPLAKEALAAVKDGRTRILPRQWENTYYDWMENIRDWCISRQIWWGHRIPAWFCDECGELTVAMEDPAVCRSCGSSAIHQETDVLDTWFSSALWPFSTMGWPDKTPELERYYPTSCLVTGFDILFFWVARMMMMGLHFMGEVPFKDVYIHALVRDAHGQKMSKSKGNVIDPLTVIDQHGTDAFRFTLAAFAAQGRDIKLSEERIVGYRNFCNKVWNAARFTLMNLEGYQPSADGLSTITMTDADRWILHRLNQTIAETTRSLEEYRFNEAAMTLYQFTWTTLCDWYLELSKGELYSEDPERIATARTVLVTVFETLLRLLHPFMPFITEEVWQALPKVDAPESIMLAAFPTVQTGWDFPEEAARMEQVMGVISAIRTMRGEMEVPPSRQITALLSAESQEGAAVLEAAREQIQNLARLGALEIGVNIEKPADAAVQPAGQVQVFLPLKGLVDVAEELKRLTKEIAKLDKEVELFSKKLSNPSFVDRAPADIVEKEKAKLAEVIAKKEILVASFDKINALA